MERLSPGQGGAPGFVPVTDGVYLLREPFGGTTTGIVLFRGAQNILIDAGGSAALVDSVVVPALAAEGLRPCDIDVLTCTHTHGDHIGGFARMRALGVKQIAAYIKSADKIRDPLYYNVEIRRAFPENSPPPSAGLVGTTVDTVLADGALLGGRLELIATPGHDDDAVCFLDRETGTLVCGDSVQLDGTAVQGCGAYMYLADYRASMARLGALHAARAILGHPFIPAGDIVCGAKAVDALFDTAIQKTGLYRDFVKACLDAGETDTATVARKLVDFVGGIQPAHLFLPMYTVQEHMKELL